MMLQGRRLYIIDSNIIGPTNNQMPVMRDLHSTSKTTGISVLAPVAGATLSLSWYGP